MGFKVLQLGFWVLIICLFNSSFMTHWVVSLNITRGNVLVDGEKEIGTTDTDFVCATLDWWPPETCNYGTCSWDQASLLNLDLNNTILMNAVKAFSPLKLRLGGTLQDRIIYETEDIDHPPCNPSSKTNNSSLFGFTQGCLPLHRWDQLNAFFNKSGAKVVFGLNFLNGRTILDGSVTGSWDPTNAKSFIQYSIRKGYNNILGWELGNELTGTGSKLRIEPDQYASDIISFQNVIQDAYKDTEVKPLILAPGGFFNPVWFREFLSKTNSTHFDIATHHIYNLGPGSDNNLVNKILNPAVLDQVGVTFKGLQNVINESGNSVQAWVGEAGGVYGSGRNRVSNCFVNSFWYLDQLGLASSYDTKTYCRQTLIGGNYGLLNTSTFKPNPDYYSALLWHRLMGKKALSTQFSRTKTLRAYAHCSKQSQGITLLLMNLDKTITVEAKVKAVVNGTNTITCRRKHKFLRRRHHHHHHQQYHPRMREEYRLTGKDGNLQTQSVLLNGKLLNVDDEDSNLPRMDPVSVNAKEPIIMPPLSILFAHIPHLCLPACF